LYPSISIRRVTDKKTALFIFIAVRISQITKGYEPAATRIHVYSTATPISRCYGMLIGKDSTGGSVDGKAARWVRGEEEHPGPPRNDVREC
jgi:hypothetical protein